MDNNSFLAIMLFLHVSVPVNKLCIRLMAKLVITSLLCVENMPFRVCTNESIKHVLPSSFNWNLQYQHRCSDYTMSPVHRNGHLSAHLISLEIIYLKHEIKRTLFFPYLDLWWSPNSKVVVVESCCRVITQHSFIHQPYLQTLQWSWAVTRSKTAVDFPGNKLWDVCG